MSRHTDHTFATLALLLTLVGFILHFGWEYFQCSPFFRHGSVQPNVSAMISVTLGDLVILWLAFAFATITSRSISWYKRHWSLQSLASVILPSALIVSVIEIMALRNGRWSYTSANPIVPWLGISLLPILQMALINPAAIFLSKTILNSLANAKLNPKENL